VKKKREVISGHELCARVRSVADAVAIDAMNRMRCDYRDHNFMAVNVTGPNNYSDQKYKLFCTKCGETRTL